MMRVRLLGFMTLLCAVGCGGGDGPQPPVETAIYISGQAGLTFTFPENDPSCPPQQGTGIQAPNASHQFGDRVFQTPHLFMLENAQQPVQAMIKNTSSEPIRADLFLGLNPQVSNFIIEAGACERVAVTSLPPPTPSPSGFNIQIEVCAPTGGLNVPCIGDPPTVGPPADNGVFYFATVGDIEVTHITSCQLAGVLSACQTSSTFFLEQPKDEIDAIMSVNPGQVNGVVRLEVYVDGALVGVQGGNNPVVSETL